MVHRFTFSISMQLPAVCYACSYVSCLDFPLLFLQIWSTNKMFDCVKPHKLGCIIAHLFLISNYLGNWRFHSSVTYVWKTELLVTNVWTTFINVLMWLLLCLWLKCLFIIGKQIYKTMLLNVTTMLIIFVFLKGLSTGWSTNNITSFSPFQHFITIG